MNRNTKIILIAIMLVLFIIIISAFNIKDNNLSDGKLKIVTTTFSTYDFAKHIVGDKANVIYLLGPGVDSHSYEPTSKDLITIQDADMFIYIGGELEQWTDKVLQSDSLNIEKTTIIKVTDSVETIQEQEIDGAEKEVEEEEEGAFDEHIWSSPENAIKMMNYLNEKISALDSKNKDSYKENTDNYIAEIRDVQSKIQEVVDNKKRNRLVFGDKMPMQYFLNEYGLEASAAFNGCSTETEPSAKTIAYLVNKVKEENIPVVLYIELSTGKTAKTIAEETGAEALQIQALHNVSKDDFNNGETYVSLMYRNIDVLKKALQ